MSWETKYILGHYDLFHNKWEAHFQLEDYSGTVEYIEGSISPIRFNNQLTEEFTHSPIKASYMVFEILERTQDAYIELVQKDKASKVIVYKSDVLYWQGWTQANNYLVEYNQPPRIVTIEAVDGLTLLKDVQLSVATSEIDSPGIYTLKKFIRQAIDEIGLETSFYESLNIYDTHMNDSNSPIDETSLHTHRFYQGGDDEDEIYKDLYTVLEMILLPYGARIYQRDGCWYIDQIKQLKDGTITYRHYNSSFSYVGESVEERNRDITNQFADPILAPIFTLHKEVDQPYSRLKLTVDYSLTKNIIRYPTIYDINGDTVQVTIDNKNRMTILKPGISGTPQHEGVIYNLGQFTQAGTPNGIMTFHITGTLRGRLRVRLFIDSGAKSYYYVPVWPGAPDLKDTWDEFGTGGGPPPVNDMLYVDYSSKDYPETFDEQVDIKNNGYQRSGTLYLLICPPWDGEPSNSLTINLDELSLEYNECSADKRTIALHNDQVLANKRELDISLYSAPMRTVVTQSGTYLYSFINPDLVYPGLLYYNDGEVYQPCYGFAVKGESYERTLEQMLVEDVMTYYSTTKLRVTGALLGDVNIGDVIDYKDKRYMPISLMANLRYATVEVVLLQISELEEFLITQSGSEYVLTESGSEYIQLEGG